MLKISPFHLLQLPEWNIETETTSNDNIVLAPPTGMLIVFVTIVHYVPLEYFSVSENRIHLIGLINSLVTIAEVCCLETRKDPAISKVYELIMDGWVSH